MPQPQTTAHREAGSTSNPTQSNNAPSLEIAWQPPEGAFSSSSAEIHPDEGTFPESTKQTRKRGGLSKGWMSWRFRNSLLSLLSINCILGFCSFNAVISICSANSFLSFGSLNSLLSVLCVQSMTSILSIYSMNSILAIGCTGKMLQICYLKSDEALDETTAETPRVQPFLGPFNYAR